MYQALFFPLSSQRNKEAKKKAWSQVNSSRPILDSTKRGKARSTGAAGHPVFSESKEVYRVENAGNKESEYGPWWGNKVRICSVDSDDGEDERPADSTDDQKIVQHTRAKCE